MAERSWIRVAVLGDYANLCGLGLPLYRVFPIPLTLFLSMLRPIHFVQLAHNQQISLQAHELLCVLIFLPNFADATIAMGGYIKTGGVSRSPSCTCAMALAFENYRQWPNARINALYAIFIGTEGLFSTGTATHSIA